MTPGLSLNLSGSVDPTHRQGPDTALILQAFSKDCPATLRGHRGVFPSLKMEQKDSEASENQDKTERQVFSAVWHTQAGAVRRCRAGAWGLGHLEEGPCHTGYRVSCLSSGVRQTLGGQRGVGWSRRSSEAMAWQAGSRVDEVLKR